MTATVIKRELSEEEIYSLVGATEVHMNCDQIEKSKLKKSENSLLPYRPALVECTSQIHVYYGSIVCGFPIGYSFQTTHLSIEWH